MFQILDDEMSGRVDLKVLYDNEAKEGFKGGWGFSCLVGGRLLFDTGSDVSTLLFNMRRFDLGFDGIGTVVLSHEHGDHVGGIEILRNLGPVNVFVPVSFSDSLKARLRSYSNVRLREVDKAEEIPGGFFTTGELGTLVREQSLVVRAHKGLTVITGCSHPGLERILGLASKLGEIRGVVGGFHDFNMLDILKSMDLIVPCHCTRRKREILRLYPDSSVECSAGCRIEL